MDYLEGIYNFIVSVPDFFVAIFQFLTTGIVEFFISLGAYIMDSLTCLVLKVALLMLDFLWAIVKVLLIDLNLSGRLTAAFAGFDNDIVRMIIFFRIPEALNLILSAFIIRFVLRLIPFL
jgi:hypothetical protein